MHNFRVLNAGHSIKKEGLDLEKVLVTMQTINLKPFGANER